METNEAFGLTTHGTHILKRAEELAATGLSFAEALRTANQEANVAWIKEPHCTSCGALNPQHEQGYSTCCNEFVTYPQGTPCSYAKTHCTHA